jgi:hypothetical protein
MISSSSVTSMKPDPSWSYMEKIPGSGEGKWCSGEPRHGRVEERTKRRLPLRAIFSSSL